MGPNYAFRVYKERKINIIGGISRNAVIGKAHRLNLSAKIKTRESAVKFYKLKYQVNFDIEDIKSAHPLIMEILNK